MKRCETTHRQPGETVKTFFDFNRNVKVLDFHCRVPIKKMYYRLRTAILSSSHYRSSAISILTKQYQQQTCLRNKKTFGIDVGSQYIHCAIQQPLQTFSIDNKNYTNNRFHILRSHIERVLQKSNSNQETNQQETNEEDTSIQGASTILVIPPYANDSERRSLRDEAELAGFKVTRVISGAAYLRSCPSNWMQQDGVVVAIDAGSSGLKVSLMNVESGVCEMMESENSHQWGSAYWNDLLERCIGEKMNTSGWKIKREELERASRELTSCEVSHICVENVESETTLIELKRSDMEKQAITNKDDKQMGQYITDILNRQKELVAQVERVILLGGWAHMPLIKQVVEDVFWRDGKMVQMYVDERPERLAAVGAASYGADLLLPIASVVL